MGIRARLHSWAAAEPGRRFDDLFNHLAGAEDLGVARSYQQEEVPAQVWERVQHDLHNVKCAGCGKEHRAPRSDGVPAAALSIRPGCGHWSFTW